MSMCLYHRYPRDGAGKLTRKKDRQVSNANLYRLATNKELKKFISVEKVNFRGTESNWIPPGYQLTENSPERYTQQKAKRKAFADMIEALIGAFLITTDYAMTWKMMQWLGLDVIPLDEQNQIMNAPSILLANHSDTDDRVQKSILELFSHRAFNEIEEKMKYVFKNKAYLIAALTHPSYSNNHLTYCYERLEYLGDAVLDFLVVRCIFVEHYQTVTPSHMTDIRQDLANNGRLAYILVCCGLEKHILHASAYLFDQMSFYLGDENIFSSGQTMRDKLGTDIDQWADSTAPKALADVFEALVGAIFLDSNYSLETVWKVIHPLLQPYINATVKHTNLNPIRSVYEQNGKIVDRSTDDKGNFVCTVELMDKQEFEGRGKNKKMAKYEACRKAMKK